MKRYIPIIVVCVCLGFADRSYGDWHEMLKKNNSSLIEGGPKVAVDVESSTKEYVWVVVTNDTGIDLAYTGYAKSDPQSFIKENINGKWVAQKWAWCGTGMKIFQLKNGSSVSVKIFLNKKYESKSYTTFIYKDSGEKKKYLTLLYHHKANN